MVIEIVLTLSQKSPLALHRSRTSVQYVETLDYIPGSSLRGSLAEAYLIQHGQPDDEFNDLFLSGKVLYGDLWPVVDGSTVLIPATSQICKRFRFEHKQSFKDMLLYALESIKDKQKSLCPECGEPLDRVGSGYLSSISEVDPVITRSRLRANSAISRGTGSSAREMLFTQHTLHGRQRFQGCIWLIDQTLREKIERLLPVGLHLYMGAGRSRGQGEVVIEDMQQCSSNCGLRERWQRFNEAAIHVAGETNFCYFSLTLLSHLSLRDKLLRPVLSEISPEHLGFQGGVEWVRHASGRPVSFLSMVVVPGWNAAQGLPKSDTIALGRGSVMLFKCDRSLEQTVLTRLSQIENERLGERREEGFGRIAACYPIHYEHRGTK